MVKRVTETFFLPDEIDRNSTRIPAPLYNLAHTLLTRSELDCVFIPIRSLLVLAVITEHEIIFVDSLSYAHQDNTGGRIILLAWQFGQNRQRDALDSPVSCEVIYYTEGARDTQVRLINEFNQALNAADSHYRDSELPADGAKIIKFKKL